MPIFSFIGYTQTELFRKADNRRQIYKQTSSAFYASNDSSLKHFFKNLLRFTALRNDFLITFKKCRRSDRWCSVKKLLEFFLNSKYCEIFKSTCFEEHLETAASENVFMKLRKIKNCS